MSDRLKRSLFLIVGTLSVILGIIGVFVPILPTTPLLLLAAACYMRSSQKLHSWLLNNRYLGTYLRNYIEGKRMSLKSKITTVVLLWVTIGLTTWFAIENVVIRAIILLIAIGVTIYILSIKTVEKKEG